MGYSKSKIYLGIIAEDISDVETIVQIIKLITKKNINYAKFLGKGCGKIANKCHGWSKVLKLKGCTTLIILRDSDTSDQTAIGSIRSELLAALSPSPIEKFCITIPVQELEAWLLCDPNAIKKALKLPKVPKINGFPENIVSPKEHIEMIVSRCDKTKKYIHTAHNKKIAEHISIDKLIKTCPSFLPFYDFVLNNIV